jgi:hypothetical protein
MVLQSVTKCYRLEARAARDGNVILEFIQQ